MDILEEVSTVAGRATYNLSDPGAWQAVKCPSCGNPTMVTIAKRLVRNVQNNTLHRTNSWLYCMGCRQGAVENERTLSPAPTDFPTPEGTPELEKAVWEEVRRCLSVRAYNAVAMLCRKLLLHIVFTHQRSLDPQASPPKMKFVEAVQYLVTHGVVTTAHEALANEIKNVGNRANHELPDVSEEEARKIALFTNFLFVSIYQMPTLTNTETPFVGAAAEPYAGDLELDAAAASSGG